MFGSAGLPLMTMTLLSVAARYLMSWVSAAPRLFNLAALVQFLKFINGHLRSMALQAAAVAAAAVGAASWLTTLPGQLIAVVMPFWTPLAQAFDAVYIYLFKQLERETSQLLRLNRGQYRTKGRWCSRRRAKRWGWRSRRWRSRRDQARSRLRTQSIYATDLGIADTGTALHTDPSAALRSLAIHAAVWTVRSGCRL